MSRAFKVVLFTRVPYKIHRRVVEIAETQGVAMSAVVEVALTEFLDRFKDGEEIALVRRAG